MLEAMTGAIGDELMVLVPVGGVGSFLSRLGFGQDQWLIHR